jgi:hypothetical protein
MVVISTSGGAAPGLLFSNAGKKSFNLNLYGDGVTLT